MGQTENQTMEICQLLLSLIHAWGVDAEIDRLCESKLGMLRPKHPVCYGLISKHGTRGDAFAAGNRAAPRYSRGGGQNARTTGLCLGALLK